MSDLELTLNTDITRFEQWLDRYNTIPSRIFDLDNGRRLSVHGSPTIRNEYSGFIKHEILANYLEPNPNDPYMDIISFELEFPVIELELFESSKDRINVKISLKHPAVTNIYQDLLRGISQRWPEVIPQIKKYIGEEAINIPSETETNSKIQESAQPLRIAPKRPGHRDKWVIVWKYIELKRFRKMGMPLDSMREAMEKDKAFYHGPIFKVETMKKIIRAGEAGELETT